MSALNDRVALVTGAAQGIGAAVAETLFRAGARVAVADVRVEASRQTSAAIDPEGMRAVPVEVDVRSRGSVARAFETAEAALGAVDILVNNAAITAQGSVWEIEPEEWDDVLAVNLRGTLLCSQIAGPAMAGRGFGRIVNLASLAGQQGGTLAGAHYAASKAGILVLTKILAKELAGKGVTVNAVVPAAIRGPVMDTMPPERLAALERTIPVGRFGEAAEVAALVAFLCSSEAGYITGAALDINGGLGMR
jgi:3-oxoacyl-[acyl-carrier protein] reductase